MLKPRWTRLGVTPSPAQSRNLTGLLLVESSSVSLADRYFLLPTERFLGRHSKEEPVFLAGWPRVSQGRVCSLVLQGKGSDSVISHQIPSSQHAPRMELPHAATEPPTKPAGEGVRAGRTHTHTPKNPLPAALGWNQGDLTSVNWHKIFWIDDKKLSRL